MRDVRSVDGSLVVCHRTYDVMSLNLLDLPVGCSGTQHETRVFEHLIKIYVN